MKCFDRRIIDIQLITVVVSRGTCVLRIIDKHKQILYSHLDRKIARLHLY